MSNQTRLPERIKIGFLKHQHLIGRNCPVTQQVHIAGLYPLNQSFWLEPASL